MKVANESEDKLTLVIGMCLKNSIWILSDRRLSSNKKVVTDEAVKIFHITGIDGDALVAYAGLGETIAGMQPSAWMARTLRGIKGLTVEQSLGFISDKMREQLPRHLERFPKGVSAAHETLAVALIKRKSAMFGLDFRRKADGSGYQSFFAGFKNQKSKIPSAPRLLSLGSGASYLNTLPDDWMIELLNIATACDRERIKPNLVIEQLVKINMKAASGDSGTGPNCIVCYRHNNGDGFTNSFRNGIFKFEGSVVPYIANGIDMGSIAWVMNDTMIAMWDAMAADLSTPDIDHAKTKQRLESLDLRNDDEFY